MSGSANQRTINMVHYPSADASNPNRLDTYLDTLRSGLDALPGTVPGLKIGSFTRDLTTASGTQAVTGVGFQPRMVFFLCSRSGAGQIGSIGADNGTTPLAVSIAAGSAAGLTQAQTTHFVGETLAAYQTFTITSLSSDGFTVTWTKTSTPSGNAIVAFVAIR